MRNPANWDEVFFVIAKSLATRSKDPSTQCGSVLVGVDRVVLASGFNGPPPQLLDEAIPWEIRPNKYAYIMHSEENALWYAVGGHGFDRIKGSTMYCTHAPCAECVLRMIRCGVAHCKVSPDAKAYPMSKYLVNPQDIIDCQAFPKLSIETGVV